MSSLAWLVQWADSYGVQMVASLAVWATLVLAVAWVVTGRLRRSASAVRYCVWQLGLTGLLVLPMLHALVPGIPLGLSLAAPAAAPADIAEDEPVLELDPSPAHGPTPEVVAARRPATIVGESMDGPPAYPELDEWIAQHTPIENDRPPNDTPNDAQKTVAQAATIGATPHWPVIPVSVWGLGVLANVLWLAFCTLRVRSLLRSAQPLGDARFEQIQGELQPALPAARRVRLMTSTLMSVPAVVGFCRPRILLPAGCTDWSAERIRIVLAHELAHVERQDIFWQLVARLSAAMYWFHPLVWLAIGRMRAERERSCDDRVLSAGVQPIDYAAGLVDVAAALVRDETFAVGGIGMASRCQLEDRLRAILDRSSRRGPASVGVRRALAIGTAVVVVALGLLRPFSPVRAFNPAAAGVGPPAGGVAALPSEQLLPDTTKGFVSVGSIARLGADWAKTEFGRLLADPIMQPFASDLRRQLEDEWNPLYQRLSIGWSDLSDVAAGEMAVAVVSPSAAEAALVLIVDVTNRRDKTAALLAQIDKDFITLHDATSSKIDLAENSVVSYAMPKSQRLSARSAYFCVKQDRLIATDDLEVLRGVLARFAAPMEDSLAALPAFKSVIDRCQKAAGDQTPHVRWFIEPFGYAEAERVANPGAGRRRETDMLAILKSVGFTAIQGVGGYVHLATEKFELLHQTAVYAPPIDRGENRYKLAANMLDLPNGGNQMPPAWVPRDVASYTSFNFKPRKAFDASESLVNAIVGDTVFADIVQTLDDDPNGPQINLRTDLVDLLYGRATIVSDYPQPIGAKSERILVAVKTTDELALSTTIERSMLTDPTARRRAYDKHTVWEIVDADASDADGSITLAIPGSAVAVAHGHLLVASHYDFLTKMLDQLAQREQLAGSHEYRRVKTELDKLSGGKACAQTFSRTEAALRAPYELIRTGRMSEAETVLGKLLRGLLQDSRARVPRTQLVNGARLPEYDAVRRYFGPGGATVVSEDDGWFLTGFTLAQATGAQAPAAKPAEAKAEQATKPALPPADPTPARSIAGTVRDGQGQPIAGATVRLYSAGVRGRTTPMNDPYCYAACGQYATTNKEGRFSIASLNPSLVFHLMFVAEGYKPRFTGEVDPADGRQVDATLDARPLPDDPDCVVTGVVVDPMGKPAVGALVEPYSRQLDGARTTVDLRGIDALAVTDDAGRFVLVSEKPIQSLDLRVEARGAARRNFERVPSASETNRLALEPETTVEGRVVNDGQGVPGVSIGVMQEHQGHGGRDRDSFLGPFEAETDAAGRFSVAGLPAGKHLVVYGIMDSLRDIGAIPTRQFTSAAGAATNLGDLPVERAYRVAGRLVLAGGKPLP